jgi:hypothetical protein
MDIRGQVSGNALANATATRDWRIHADFVQRLIGVVRELYINEPFRVDLANTAHLLGSTTICLSLSLFPRAPFRTAKAVVKEHVSWDSPTLGLGDVQTGGRTQHMHSSEALQRDLPGLSE